MKELVNVYKSLADPSRIRVLNLFLERECCVCEVMQVMNISQSKASRILTTLYNAGLLKLRKEGRWALYSIETDPAKDYVKDILASVRHALTGNPVAADDIKRLKKAERIGPVCITGACKTQPAS